MKVLIVDDEIDTSEGLRDFLPWNELGINQVYITSDGVEALELTQRVKPDIIITDIRMPKMDGIEYIDKIRMVLPTSKIIFMSAYSDKDYLKSAIKFNVVSYVEKPINPEEMTAAVRTAVRMLNKERSNSELSHSLALRLTESNVNIPEIIPDLNSICPDFLSNGYYCTLMIRTASQNSRVYKQLSEMASLRKAVDASFSAHLSTILENGWIIFHICDKSIISELFLRSSVQKIVGALNRELKLENGIFISVGCCVAGIDNIWKSYMSAVNASLRFFFTGYGSMVFHGENSNNKPFKGDSVNIFEKSLRLNDKTSAMEILEELSTYVRLHQDLDIDSIRNVFFNLTMCVTTVGRERNFPADTLDSRDFVWKSIADKETFNDIYNYLLDKTKAFFSCLDNLSQCKPVYKIIMYIEENYTHRSLSISEIADNIHLTPAYICNLFKKETGKTITQYLNSYRIEKAKILLQQRHLKLSDIASQVGYSDVNYFMRIFKKNTGLIPSEYRNKFLIR